MLPNFFIVGAQKGGTTSLHHYLAGHPDIYLPKGKETKFFVDDTRYERGIAAYEAEHFSGWSGQKAVGEVDPDYMYFEPALDRMVRDLDIERIRFVFVLREQSARAFSHYLMTYRRGVERLAFEEAIATEAERIGGSYLGRMHYSYLDRGCYCRQIGRFLEHVDRSSLLFLLSDDLQHDPAGTLGRVLEFLGVSTSYIPQQIGKKFHQSTVPRSLSLLDRIENRQGFEKRISRLLMPSEKLRKKLRQKILDWNQTGQHGMELKESTRQMLIENFREENRELAALIGRDLNGWTRK